MKNRIKKIPIVGRFAVHLYRQLKKSVAFSSSEAYWEKRYLEGGNSGPGSYNRLAAFKAEVINTFIKNHQVVTVIDFGFGDGNQLRLLKVPTYLGFEVSDSAVSRCQQIFRGDDSKTFKHLREYSGEQADLTMSLDVLYHLVEDRAFDDHMMKLFSSARKYVAIYASNFEEDEASAVLPHVKRRKFTPWVGEHRPEFQLKELVPNQYPFDGDAKTTSRAEFYIYERI